MPKASEDPIRPPPTTGSSTRNSTPPPPRTGPASSSSSSSKGDSSAPAAAHTGAGKDNNGNNDADVDPALPELTLADINKIIAASSKKRVVVVRGVVYDLTNFVQHHPGGSGVFTIGNGKDVTRAYDSMHGRNPKVLSKLRHWVIGRYVPDQQQSSGGGDAVEEVDEELDMADVKTRILSGPNVLVLILFGDVYDVTSFGAEHPGGVRVLANHNGQECGDIFMRIHGLRARDMVARYYIGRFKDSGFASSPLRRTPTTGGGESGGSEVQTLTEMRAASTRLLSIEPVAGSTNLRCLTFACPHRMVCPPGGHMKVFSNVKDGSGRFYTPFKTEIASFSLCVKLYPGGATSGYLFGLREGDEMRYDGPFAPNWLASADENLTQCRLAAPKRHVLLLAGGTGAAPLYTIARDILECRAASVTMVLSVRNREQLLLGDELGELEARHSHGGDCSFSLFVAFSQSFSSADAAIGDGDGGALVHGLRLSLENTLYGKIDAAMLRRLPLPGATQAVVVCGPDSFDRAMPKCAVDAGVCADKCIHVLDEA